MNPKACTADIHNYAKLAAGFFEGYRIPAALLTGVSMMALFHVHRIHRIGPKTTKWEKIFISHCHLAFFTAFILSGMVLLISSTAPIRLLRHNHGQFEQSTSTITAESPYDFLKEEFPFEFLVVRWSFIVSIISCLRGVMIHTVLDHHLLRDMDEKKRAQFAMVITAGVAMLTCLFAYLNSNLYSWDNFFYMTWDLLKIIWDETFGEKPLKIVSLFSAGISLGLFAKSTLTRGDDGGDTKKKKSKSPAAAKMEEDEKTPTVTATATATSAKHDTSNKGTGTSSKVKVETHQ